MSDIEDILMGEDDVHEETTIYYESSLPPLKLFIAVVQCLFQDLSCTDVPRVLGDCQRLKDKAWRYLNSPDFEEYCDNVNMDVSIFRKKGRTIYENHSQMGLGNYGHTDSQHVKRG